MKSIYIIKSTLVVCFPFGRKYPTEVVSKIEYFRYINKMRIFTAYFTDLTSDIEEFKSDF